MPLARNGPHREWQKGFARSSLVSASLLLAGLAAACGQITGSGGPPQGQVLAVVNGEEITASQLKAEAEASRRDLKEPAVRNELLNKIIERHLQATVAAERGLDRNPQYLAHKRRLEQEMLARLFIQSKADSAEAPKLHEVRMFILRNPHLFEEAQQLVVDRLSVTPAEGISQAEIDAVDSLAEAERLIASKGARGERRTIEMDPASLSPEIALQLMKLGVGEVFFARIGTMGMFAAIVERRPAPVPPKEQLQRAAMILKRQKSEEAASSAGRQLMETAKIRYQKGYGPPKGSTTTPPK